MPTTIAADAEIIADYCQRQEPTRWTPPAPELKKLKHLYRCSAALKDELTLLNNHPSRKDTNCVLAVVF